MSNIYKLTFILTISLIMSIYFVACGSGIDPSGTHLAEDTKDTDDTEAMVLSPSTVGLSIGKTQTFTASNSEGTLTFEVLEGAGSIDSATGVYTAPYNEGTAVIQVTDASENTAQATITYGALWTWEAGGESFDASGTYGTQGTAAEANTPGSRSNSVSWVDSDENLWLFGGYGIDSAGDLSYLNDLWKFDSSTSEWTWVAGSSTVASNGTFGDEGVASTSNIPSARTAAVHWKDSSGNFWLFGGLGYDEGGSSIGELNDLWKFDPTSLEWTLVDGSSCHRSDNACFHLAEYGTQGVASTDNIPGARKLATSWIDSNDNLWLFGGSAYDDNDDDASAPNDCNHGTPSEPERCEDVGYYNDLWKYNISTSEWTWVSGDKEKLGTATYGTKGTAAAANTPGARTNATSWIDADDNLWFFGGDSTPITTGLDGELNDLWKFNTTTSEWTWVTGEETFDYNNGDYGTQWEASDDTSPRGRTDAVAWVRGNKLFMFGGMLGNNYKANDLWMFDPSTTQWTWLSGSKDANIKSVFDEKGTASFSTYPGARKGTTSWVDSDGNLWLFGGLGNPYGRANDLWKL